MAFEEITAAMKILSSTLSCHLDLCAGITSELGALTRGGYLELRDGIHADAIRKLLVHAGVGYGLAVDREVILIRPLAVERGRTGDGICGSTGYGFEKSGEIAAVERDVHDLPAGNDTGSFRRHGLECHGLRFDRDGFRL